MIITLKGADFSANNIGSLNDVEYQTISLASFMDLVGTTSGSINYDTSTGAPVYNGTSANWRYAKISLAEYDIKRLTLVTGTAGNGVAPVIFTSSATVTKENLVDKRYGAGHQYITNEHMTLLTGNLAIPDGATYMIISELLNYNVASSTNAEELKAMCNITYRVKA